MKLGIRFNALIKSRVTPFILLGVSVILPLLLLLNINDMSSDLALYMNVLGRQRLLSEQLYSASLNKTNRRKNPALQETLHRFDENLNALRLNSMINDQILTIPSTTVATMIDDLHREWLSVRPSFAALAGITPRAGNITPEQLHRITAKLIARIENILTTIEHIEHKQHSHNAWIIFIASSISIMLIGFAVFLLSVYRKWIAHIDHALQESEARLRLGLHAANIGSWQWDIPTGNLTCSDNTTALFGVTKENFNTNVHFFQSVHPQDRLQVIDAVNDCIERNTLYSIEHRCIWQNGTVRWLLGRGYVTRDVLGNPKYMRGVVQDITARKTAEQALATQLRRNQIILATAQEGFIVTDTQGRLHEVNQSYIRLSGYSREELIGMYVAELEMIEDQEALAKHMEQVITQGHHRFETRHRRKDGSVIDLEVSANVVEDTLNERFFYAFLQDITARKAAEASIQIYQQHLEDIVTARTRDLIEARDAALAAERTMSTFLANMSHELRTPLHGILSYASFGVKKLSRAPLEKLGEYFREVHASGTQLLTLINDLLDLSKLRAGKMVYDYSEHDLTAMVKLLEMEFGMRLDEGKQTLRLTGTEQPLLLQMDRVRINQVLRNLVSNAMKFSPVGSTIQIDIAHDSHGGAQISVHDQGPGIPSTETEAIFQPFIQGSHTQSGAGGTGLGLSICREIVQVGHGGYIWAENRIGGGASFVFTLPLQVTCLEQVVPPATLNVR